MEAVACSRGSTPDRDSQKGTRMARTRNPYYLVAAVLSALSGLVIFVVGGEYRWLWYVFMLAAAGFGRLGELLEKQSISGPVATATLEDSATEDATSPAPAPPTKLGFRGTLKCAVGMLFRPRKTVRTLLDRNSPGPYHLLVMLAGIAYGLNEADGGAFREATEPSSIRTLLFVSAYGAAIGVCLLYTLSWLLALSGRLLGSHATAKQLRIALAWGGIPMVWSLVPKLPALILFPTLIFADTIEGLSSGTSGVLLVSAVGTVISQLWTFISTLMALREAQQFSWGRVVVTVIILVLCSVLLMTLVFALSPAR
jgi:Yip1-like protein